MEKIDIRNIYVCEIMKQTGVKQRKPSNEKTDKISFEWGYEEGVEKGLFVKSLGGYKHILTGTTYTGPSEKTGHQHVINQKTVEKFTKAEREMANEIIRKNGTYEMDLDIVYNLENKINHGTFDLEEDGTIYF